MTTTYIDDQVLFDAVALAVRVPSIHDATPWRFRVGDGQIELHVDRTQPITITNRAVLVSCGAALFGARISLQAAGCLVSVRRLPDPGNPDHLATLTVCGRSAADPDVDLLVKAIDRCLTWRCTFGDRLIDSQTRAALVDAGAAEDATLLPITEPDDAGAAFLLVTDDDTPIDRLRAGEAMARILLTATDLGLAGCPYTQPLDIRDRLATLDRFVGGYGKPQIVLRMGWPRPTPLTSHCAERPVAEIVDHLMHDEFAEQSALPYPIRG